MATWRTAHPLMNHPACETPGWQFIAGSGFEPRRDSLEASVHTFRPSWSQMTSIHAACMPVLGKREVVLIPHLQTITHQPQSTYSVANDVSRVSKKHVMWKASVKSVLNDLFKCNSKGRIFRTNTFTSMRWITHPLSQDAFSFYA